jgi:hypothetical protein
MVLQQTAPPPAATGHSPDAIELRQVIAAQPYRPPHPTTDQQASPAPTVR